MNKSSEQYNWLPARIASSVFWMLAVVGFLTAFFLLRGIEEDVITRHISQVDKVSIYIMESLLKDPDITEAALRSQTKSFIENQKIPAAHIATSKATMSIGEAPQDYSLYKRKIKMSDGAEPGGFSYVTLTVFMHGVKGIVLSERKQTVVVIGIAFVLIGISLQWFLQKIISRPFTRMVNTAKKCAAGRTNIRFDASRKDEFGFLSRFINEALDFSCQKQTEVEKVLVRMRDSEIALHAEKDKLEVTLSSIGDAVITTDNSSRIDYMNPVAENLTGVTLRDAKGAYLDDVVKLVDEISSEPIDSILKGCLEKNESVPKTHNAILIARDGEEIPVAESASSIRDCTSAVIGAVLVLHDEGSTRKLAKQLSHQAAHDALTGLVNRREFERRLAMAIDDIKNTGRHAALCYLDLDQFKIVNDTCGHVAGDELLRQLSCELQKQVRDSDVLARLGGDEFGVLLNGCDLQQAERVADALWRTVSDYRFAYDGKSFEVGVSIGLVSMDNESVTMSDIMSAADVACYAAKDTGRNRIHVYRPSDHDMQVRQGEMQWVTRIRNAIKDDRFCLFLQSIIPLDNTEDQKPHYEVLLRLMDEDGETVPPMAFIPAAERYNLMPLVDRWVVKSVTENYGLVASTGEGVVFTVNLSGQSLCDEKFLDFVITCIAESDIDAKQICFEITETAAITNLMRATRFINVLRKTGCKFALDDFGSGLSSFGYLKTLKVDYIKIDGSFVRDMVNDPADHAMVEAINRIGHIMGIETIAEFVENEEIFNKLKELKVNYAQGYWIGRPQLLEEVIQTNLETRQKKKLSA